MKKITTSSGIFGPYSIVETLLDRYRCDGADLPFTVVGTGTIEDWISPFPVYAPLSITIPLPEAVTMRQTRLALLSAGILNKVNSTIAGMTGDAGDAARIEWEFSSDVKRNQPLVTVMGKALNMTESQLDDLFILAASL